MEKTRKSLKEISPLFLSALEQERKTLPCLSFIGVERDCSFLWNGWMAHSILSEFERVFIVDFHPPLLAWEDSAARIASPSIEPVLFPPDEIDFNFGGNGGQQTHASSRNALMKRTAILWDLPWHRLDLLDSVIEMVDHFVFIAEPSVSSLRKTYRLMKACLPLRPHSFALLLVSEKQVEVENRFADHLSRLTEQFLRTHFHYLGTLQREKALNFVLPPLFWERVYKDSRNGKISEAKTGLFEWLVETAQRSEKDRETGRFLKGVALTRGNGWKKSRSFPHPHFYDRGRLGSHEILAFLDISPPECPNP